MLRRVVGFAVHAFTLQNPLVEKYCWLYLNPLSQILFFAHGYGPSFSSLFPLLGTSPRTILLPASTHNSHKAEAVETLNDEMDKNRANYSMAAFVTSEKFPRRWSRFTAYASVTVNQIGVFLLPLKTLFCHFSVNIPSF